MGYKRYKMLQKYINGEPQEEYRQGELIDDTIYQTLDACNDGNQKPDEPIEGYIYQWVTVSGEYVCNDVNKYTKEKEQKSSNNGVTWTDTGRTRQGDLIEANSVDCGYVPPTPSDYSKQYLTFEALENGTFTFTGKNGNSLSYSLDDGTTWTALASGTASPTVTSGNKIMWKGTCKPNNTGIGDFSSTGTFNVYGNTMSIVHEDNFRNSTTISYYQFAYMFHDTKVVNAENLILPATTLPDHCYSYMFSRCTYLTEAPQLPATTMTFGCYQGMFNECTRLVNVPELPATTLGNSCYYQMFRSCTNLVNAPALPATTLADYCYEGMFYRCTNLVNAPALPATTLAFWCYYEMFYNCTSLTTAPQLPATTLATQCYQYMFYGCTKLNYIKAMFTTTPSTSYTKNWVDGVAASGTFVKNSAATWNVTGVNGIPSGWTVVTE